MKLRMIGVLVVLVLSLASLPAFAAISTVTIDGSTPAGVGTMTYTIGSPLTSTGGLLNDKLKTDFGICPGPTGCTTSGTMNFTTGAQTFTTCPGANCVSVFGSGGSFSAAGTYGAALTPYSITGTWINSTVLFSPTATPGVLTASFSGNLDPTTLSIIGFGTVIPNSGSAGQIYINVTFSVNTFSGTISASHVEVSFTRIPEPASLGLLGAGLLVLGSLARKRLLSR